jgi:hypothetical protein
MPGIHDEPVEVACRADEPEQFLLCGRLYVVRGVLARWVEPSSWRWAAPADEVPLAVVGASTGGSAAAGGWRVPSALPRRQPAGRSTATDTDADREVWRVAAAAGRTAAVQVFDLCRSRVEARWTATRVEEDQL